LGPPASARSSTFCLCSEGRDERELEHEAKIVDSFRESSTLAGQNSGEACEIDQLKERIRGLEEQLAKQSELERLRSREDARQFTVLLAELAEAANELSDRQLRHLGPELEVLGALLEGTAFER
jgi:hypothetical protein